MGAFWVTLDQGQLVGESAGFGVEEGDAGLAGGEVQCGTVVVAVALALVDEFEGTSGVEDIAEGGEGLGGERFGL